LHKGSGFSSWRINSEGQARKAIRESVIGLYAVAGIQAIAFLYLAIAESLILYEAALSAFLLSGLGLWMHKTKSKIAATFLLVLSTMSVGTTMWNRFGGGEGGQNIILALMILGLAIRAAVATYKLRHLK
jgi:hypothetical protein